MNKIFNIPKKIILISLLFFSCINSSYATWDQIGLSARGTYVAINKDSILKNGNIVNYWVLYSYENAIQGTSVLSLKNNKEINCTTKKLRIIYEVQYEGSYGSGTPLATINADEKTWSPIVPDSMAEAEFKYICKKK